MKDSEIIYGKKKIKFSIEYRERKSLEISVLPDKSVKAIAPLNAKLEDITEKVKKRAKWILKQQDYFTQFLPKEKERKYVSGETHRYLGKQYLLKITESDINEVKLNGKYIIIYSIRKNDTYLNKRLLYKWYKLHAMDKFNTILDSCLEKLKKYSITKPEIQIKKMKSRWGSCDIIRKRVILNIELIKAPGYGIEYVIMHELCHFKYSNHDSKFYNFLSTVMPDWKIRKEKLERVFI